MIPLVSMVIPIWNGASRIHIPLEALANQSVSCEIIVVNNASTDDLAGAVQLCPAWSEMQARGMTCKIVHEARAGATYARLRGLLEATSELVCFLDDDNGPEPGYIEAGVTALADPTVGILISRIYPVYEQQPPRSMIKREHLLAINFGLGEKRIEWDASVAFAPTVTAGMWVRRQAFLDAVPWRYPEKLLADRKGGSLACGGDIEIGFLIGRAGYKRVYSPNLRLKHYIPMARLRSSYFCRLILGIVRSEITLRERYLPVPNPSRGRAAALGRLFFACIATPALVLGRDGMREALFVLVSRWACVQGPYPVAASAAEPSAA